MIRTKNFQKGSFPRTATHNGIVPVPANALGAGYIFTAAAASTMTVGTALVLNAGITRTAGWPHSLLFTGSAATTTWSFAVVGKNQFGDVVRETVTIAAGQLTVFSLFCYREITSITPLTLGGAAETMAIGFTWLMSAVPTPSIALPARITRAGTVNGTITQMGSAVIPTYTVTAAPYYKINFTGTAPINNPFGILSVPLDGADPSI